MSFQSTVLALVFDLSLVFVARRRLRRMTDWKSVLREEISRDRIVELTCPPVVLAFAGATVKEIGDD